MSRALGSREGGSDSESGGGRRGAQGEPDPSCRGEEEGEEEGKEEEGSRAGPGYLGKRLWVGVMV